jgi:hypothetical protein
MTWLLILFAHAGIMSDKDSMALTTATFGNEAACIAAGEQAKKMANNTLKVIKYTCVKQG